jgi:hypothetical protein
MRKQPEWVAKWDDRILEYLYERGPASPGQISDVAHIRTSSSYVSRRLSTLFEHELVARVGNGVYQITDKGKYYLAGGYDPQTDEYLHDIEPDKQLYNYERVGVLMRELAERDRHR